MQRPLNALYYPHTVCLEENTLKYMVLHFDKIFFLPNDVRLNPGHTSISKRWSPFDGILAGAYGTRADAHYMIEYCSEPDGWSDRTKALMETYDELEVKGVCVPIQDAAFEAQDREHPLIEAVKADVNDPVFVEKCTRARNKKIFIPTIDPSRQAKSKGGGFITRSTRYASKDVMFAAISSERINSALYWADAYDLAPVANHRVFEDLCATKLKRLVASPEFMSARGVSQQTDKIRLTVLQWQLFREVIPAEAVVAKSVSRILSYKQEASALQERYRTYLSALEAEMSSEPWDDKLSREVDRLIRKKIIPEIQRLNDDKKTLWEKFFAEAVTSTMKGKVLYPLVAVTALPAISYAELLWYGTLALGSAAAWAGDFGPKVVEMVAARRQLKKSALFFLLNFR